MKKKAIEKMGIHFTDTLTVFLFFIVSRIKKKDKMEELKGKGSLYVYGCYGFFE